MDLTPFFGRIAGRWWGGYVGCMRTLIAVLLLALASPAVAEEVYKWVDENGVVHYTDHPPSKDAKPAKLPPLQTYKGGTTPDLNRYDKGPKDGKGAAAEAAQVQVVTPSQDETFRSAERTVPIAVLVTPALREGQRLIYVVDGKPVSMPTTDTAHALTGVDRGSHSVVVTLVDEAGQELAQSRPVTFHMKPPIARK